MPLSRDTIKQYRAIGHNLKPVVIISDKGVSEGVINELNRAFDDHELIKVKINVNDREARKQLIEAVIEQCRAENVQEIGKVALLFREAAKPNPKTSNVRRL